MKRLFGALVALVITLLPIAAHAHALVPVGLLLRETATGTISVRLERPVVIPNEATLEPVLPQACRMEGSVQTTESAGRAVEERRYVCSGWLERGEVGLRGLDGADIDAVLRVELAGGRVHRAILTAREPIFTIPESPSAWVTMGAYVRLGMLHLAGGLDHLSFVLGLLLVIKGRRRLIAAITAFTVGHSITLCAAALGWAKLPQSAVEVAIAATLLVLAVEVVRGRAEKTPMNRAWPMSGAFGLLHGLGFATALGETGLPEGEVPLALGSFNLGIELGQLGVVVLAWALVKVMPGWMREGAEWQRRALGYAMGSLGGMWCIERMVAMVG